MVALRAFAHAAMFAGLIVIGALGCLLGILISTAGLLLGADATKF